MAQGFAHEAVLSMAEEADQNAPGAAVTVALCGHWEHEPPCPLAPHHVRTERHEDGLHVRILFVTEPQNEVEVRRRIDRALAGQWELPDSLAAAWELQSSRSSAVTPDEVAHTERLMRS
jgi:hypothetical protein